MALERPKVVLARQEGAVRPVGDAAGADEDVGRRGVGDRPPCERRLDALEHLGLAMLLFDGEAAVLLAALEGLFSSLRITRKPLTMAFNSGSMALSTFLTVWTLRFFFGSILDLSSGHFSSRLITATCTMAFVQYIVNSGLVAIAGSLKASPCQKPRSS